MATISSFAVSQQRSGTLTLTWAYSSAVSLSSQTVLVDSPDTNLVSLSVPVGDRSVTLSSSNVTVLYGTDHNYSFRVIGETATGLIKSTLLTNQHFYQLQAPDVSMVGVPQGMKLTFADTLPGLDNYDANQLMSGNEVTQIEISLSFSDDSGPDLDVIFATPADVDTNGVLFIGDSSVYTGGNAVGSALVDGRDYEVNVRYITNQLGVSPATFDQTVIPTDQFSAPQNVAVSRPAGDNTGLQVNWNAPANDINPDGSSTTFVGHYEVWYKASDSAPAAITNDDLDASGDPTGWTKFTSNADGGVYSASQSGLTEGLLYWLIVRAVRDAVTNEAEPDAPSNDGKINGLFSAPESGLVFNFVGVAAPIIEGYATQDATSVNVKCDYPTANGSDIAATIFASASVGNDLAAIGYSSLFEVTYADDADGTSGAVTVTFDADALSSTTIVGAIDFGSLGTKKFITSAVYKQTYKGVTVAADVITVGTETWTSANANAVGSPLNVSGPYVPADGVVIPNVGTVRDYGGGPEYTIFNYRNVSLTNDESIFEKTSYPTVDTTYAAATSLLTAAESGSVLVIRENASYFSFSLYEPLPEGQTGSVGSSFANVLNIYSVTYSESNVAASRILGSTSQQLVTFSAPNTPSGLSSSSYYNADNTPVSTGTASGDGKLYLSWTELQTNTAWSGNEQNPTYYSLLRYRIRVYDGATEVTTGLTGNEGITAETTTLGGLDNGTQYTLKIEAYFVNPDNAVLTGETDPAVNQEVTGAESGTGVSVGTTPFYYPDAVVSNTNAPSVSGDPSNLTFTWDEPAELNGVGSTGSQVELRYRYVLTTNTSTASGVWVSSASSTAITFAVGSGYKIEVWAGYFVTGVSSSETYDASSTAYEIYYAKPASPTITLSTASGSNTVVATYTDGGNDSVLVFESTSSYIKEGSSQVGDAISVDTKNGTHSFTGLTNGTQYVVYGTVTHSWGGADWTSDESSSGTGTEVLGGIPYGLPIIVADSESFNVSGITNGQAVSVSVNPNGRFIRESLFVGVPSAYSAADIGVQQTNGAVGLYGSANDAVVVTVSSVDFGYALSQALVVVENAAGSAVELVSP